MMIVFVLVCGNNSLLRASSIEELETTKQRKFHFKSDDSSNLELLDALDMVPCCSSFIEKTDSSIVSTEVTPVWRQPFAIKTNLLFNLASALNIEFEIPIGNQWSIAGEWIFPWWLWERKQVCLQVLSGNIEGRYWFGNRQNKRQLTGLFAGVYAGGGLYDLEWKTKGYQGEFFIAAGLSGGYAHTINRSGSLRMEYSFGVGYMQTQYREYIPVNGGEILSWQRDGRYSWFGPTRAKVSLVWMIHSRNKGGRLN